MTLLGSKWPLYLLILVGWTCLVGCQYQFGRGELSQRYATVSIPYVEGDEKGEEVSEGCLLRGKRAGPAVAKATARRASLEWMKKAGALR